MPQARGFQEKLLIAFETTYNETPTINDGDMVAVPFNSIGLGSDENMIDPATIISGKRYESEPIFGNVSVQGPLVVPLDVRFIGYWLKAMFGAPTTTGTGPYTHAFSPVDDNPSLVIERGFTDISKYSVFNGVKINNFNLDFSTNAELVASLDLLGGKEISPASSTLDGSPQELTITRFNAKNVVLKKGGSDVAIATNGSLKMSQTLDDGVFTLSSNGFRHSLPEQRLMINGSAELLFVDSEWIDLAINGTEFDLEFYMTAGAHSLKITLPEVKMRRQPISGEGVGPKYVPVDFKAYWQDSVDGVPIKVELINDVASYA